MADHSYMEPRQLCWELLMSIRSLEARIDELLAILSYQDGFINERRVRTIARLERIITTREELISSFNRTSKWDEKMAKGRRTYNPFNNTVLEYVDLRKQVQELLDEYRAVK